VTKVVKKQTSNSPLANIRSQLVSAPKLLLLGDQCETVANVDLDDKDPVVACQLVIENFKGRRVLTVVTEIMSDE
jgi:hypothetical protein